MKKLLFLLVCIIAGAFVYLAYFDDLAASREHCTAAYIKQVADTQGLDKARKLSGDCLSAGFASAQKSLKDAAKAFEKAGSAIGEAAEDLKEDLLNGR